MDLRSGFETKVLAAFAAAVLAVVALAATTWKVSSDAVEAALRVSHSHEVSNLVAHAIGQSHLIELSAQSHRISGDAARLAERDAAISARETSLRRLRELTADNASQQERWTQLRATIDERLAIARRTELLRETEGLESASAYVAGAPLRQTRERVLLVLGEMQDEERRLLRERSAEQARTRGILVSTGILAVLAVIALLSATLVLIRRQLRATEASSRALANSEARLAFAVERKQAADALQLVMDSVPALITRLDRDERFLFVNRGYAQLMERPAEQIIGRRLQEVVSADVYALAKPHIDAALAGKTVQFDRIQRHTGHSAQVLAVTYVPDRDASGEVCGWFGMHRDITQERLALDRLAESEQRYRTMAERSPEAIIVHRGGNMIYVNSAAVKMFGASSAQDFFGRAIFEFIHPDSRPLAQARRKSLAEGSAHVPLTEMKFLRFDGTAVDAEIQGTSIVYDGAPAIHTSLHDITGRKRSEREILDLNTSLERRVAERTQQLQAANNAKSDFLAKMSHELRTPLNSIIGVSEMMKHGLLGQLDARQVGFAGDIFDAGQHLLSLINDILDLSKVEAGMLQIEPDAVDIAALLKSSMLVVRETAHAHRIRLDLRLDRALGSMLADERKLKQIAYNLLSNAVKFSPDGGAVTLRARRCARAEVALDGTLPGRLIALPPGKDVEFLAITVEDAGVGIAEEHLPELFEPFTQVGSSLSGREGGTGLGLSLVRRLAELHGGTVGVASRPGAGSQFSVWLPYREAAPVAQEGGTAPEATAPTAHVAPLALVVEDDDWTAELIEAQLCAEGFEVMRAATAEEGLARAVKRIPQLITLDIFLPAMDGWEFLRRLKADPHLAEVPVVVISVSKDRDHGIALGARRVLQKPFVREELAAALAGLVKVRRDGDPARVLVVDDNVKAVEVVATALEAEGYRALRAYGGAEAIEAVRGAPPDLMILDLMMPEVNGFEVARVLRESEHTARIPILVLTAKDLSAEDHARLNGMVSAIMTKANFSRGALLAELRRAIDGGPTR